ncbi:hypothetical protein WA026_022012 [Henosepilachna vigintioctopunctata]|uniref:Uncharacterized protein n=1 Tax=Henosepilachna vigintioctopunctata TaxID=420089 RepID=A0AAW1V4Y0_9CUCU
MKLQISAKISPRPPRSDPGPPKGKRLHFAASLEEITGRTLQQDCFDECATCRTGITPNPSGWEIEKGAGERPFDTTVP